MAKKSKKHLMIKGGAVGGHKKGRKGGRKRGRKGGRRKR